MVTHHSSLLWVFKTTKPSTQLIRWALFIFTVEYRKGRYNTVPHALSRAPSDGDESTHSPTCATIMSAIPESSMDLSISIEAVWNARQKDPECQTLYQNIVGKGDIQLNTNTTFTIFEDLIYRVVRLPYKTMYQIYIPESLLTSFHQDPLAGHLRRYTTYRRSLVYWPKLGCHAVCDK